MSAEIIINNHIASLEKQVEILTKALEFYKDINNLQYGGGEPYLDLDELIDGVYQPFGTTADKALQAVKGDK